MATVKEKEKVRELVELAMEINDSRTVNCAVDVKVHGVEMRISPMPFEREWLFYPHEPAYFQDGPFTEDGFISQMDSYIAEARKHHPQFDADGVKL
jgi:hypothetical protein